MLNIRTIIGIGSKNQATGKVHGAALGDEDVAYVKTQLGFHPDDKFVVPKEAYEYFADCVPNGQKAEDEWNKLFGEYKEKYPEDAKDFNRRMQGKFREGWEKDLPTKDQLPKDAAPTRKSSGIAVQALVPKDKTFVAGSADLLESTFVNFKDSTEFQNPESGLGDYSGRQIRYGIREHAMLAIGNGLAAYQKGSTIPIMSTFFMFWLYAAPAARMSALQGLRFIGIATHDAIGIGEDGPTHQPIALAHFYRGLPGLNFIRPADAEEVMGAWLLALKDEDHPSLFALSRQAVPLLEGTDRNQVAKGAYPVYGSDDPQFTLIATGAEVSRAIEVAKLLEKDSKRVRVVSMPSQEHFDRQPKSYKRSVLPPTSLIVAIEAWGSLGWAKYAHAGAHMHTFGMSAPAGTLYEFFGFGPDHLAKKITRWSEEYKKGDGYEMPSVGDFEELLLNVQPEHHSPAPYKV
jgi:dihydroxyacetone synthase